MTVRALILGFAGALLLAGVGYLNDQVVGLEPIAAGDLLPISVFGLLLVLAILVNPLLYWLGDRRLRPGELATIILLMFVACSIVSGGLLDGFSPALLIPHKYNAERPGWQEMELLAYAPERALPKVGKDTYPTVVGDFLAGKGKPGKPIGLDGVPWESWRGPLSTWMPLAVLLAVAATCMGLIVHKQWSRHEHLRYPVAELGSALMVQDPNRPMGTIFRNKMFWLGLALVLTVRVINGYYAWNNNFVQVPMRISFSAVRDLRPEWWQTRYGGWLLVPHLFPTAVAFSFFLSSEIALSLGLSQWFLVLIGSYLTMRGIDLTSHYLAGGVEGWQRFGSYLAFALMILYLGRRYYGLVLRRALTFRAHSEVESYAAWACRIGLLATAAAVVLLTYWLELDWPVALVTVLLTLLAFLCVARVTAETGMFMVHPRWQALGVFIGLFGSYALGPKALVACGLACIVLSLDQGQTLLPYLINGLKICDNTGVPPKRVGPPVVVTYAVCAALGVVVVLWANYNFGIKESSFTTDRVPRMTFETAESAINELDSWGGLEAAKRLGPLESLLHIRPDKQFVWAAAVGFGLVVIVGALRYRYPWWPLHPVMFLLWGTNPMATFSHSFLLGWLIRSAITKYVGYSAVRRAKPFMIGVVAGDVFGGALFMAIGAAYFGATGLEPPIYTIFKTW